MRRSLLADRRRTHGDSMYAALAQRRAVKTFLGASYIPEVLAVVEVPGGSMADHLASVVRLFQHRLAPERRRHRIEPDRREELVGEAEHRRHIVALSTQHKQHAGYRGMSVPTCISSTQNAQLQF